MKRQIKHWILAGVVTPALLLFGSVQAQEAQTPNLGLPSGAGPVLQPQPTTPDATPPNMTTAERLDFIFSGYHFFPTKADLAALGSDAEVSAMLRELAENPDARVTMRTKAIDALGYYNDDTTISFLKHVTALDPNEATPKLKRATRSMKHHAIMALAKTLSEGAVEALEASLKDPDIQIRMTAISALGKHCGKPGKSRLQQLGKVEENPYVRRELRKYVKL